MGPEALRRQLEARDPPPTEVVGIGPPPVSPTRSPQLARAVRFLEDALLRERERPAAEVMTEAEAAGISLRTLKRAKQHLGVQVRRRGFGPGSHLTWQLRIRWLPAKVALGLLKLDREGARCAWRRPSPRRP
jgi:hypothetical protein